MVKYLCILKHCVYLQPHRGVEQLVARRAHNPKVVSSSLAPATRKKASNWMPFLLFNHSLFIYLLE